MSKHVRMWALGAAFLALGGLVYLAEQTSAGEDKEITEAVLKIADAIKKGDNDAADKGAGALAKKVEHLEEVMDMLKPRKKGGYGVGKKPGAITPDGIELKLITIGRDAPTAATLNKEAEALEEMGYIVAAIAEVARHRAPAVDKGKQKKKDWLAWSADMKNSGVKLAEAAKAKGAQDVKGAAAKLNTSCNTCHSIFRVSN